jgi:hypothetical protein
VLVGRRRRLDQLITAARGGKSSAFIVHDEPGIGKTSLIEYTVAGASDFQVLPACPREVKSELAFAGLSELLRPILQLIEWIPGPQSAALSGALALRPPAPGDRFAVAAAALLLAASAEKCPANSIRSV